MSLTSLPASSPGLEPAPDATFELLAGGEAAFERILRRIGEARRSILVRAFEWRDDDTGRSVARALLAAADRGVAGHDLEGPHRRLLRAPGGDQAELLPQEDRPATPACSSGS